MANCGRLCRIVANCGGQWRTVADSGELWRTVADCGGEWRTVADCGAAVKTSGSQSREPKFESFCCLLEAFDFFLVYLVAQMSTWRQTEVLFIPHCHSSLSCTNEYLDTDRGFVHPTLPQFTQLYK